MDVSLRWVIRGGKTSGGQTVGGQNNHEYKILPDTAEPSTYILLPILLNLALMIQALGA